MSWQCANCGFRVTGGIEDADLRHECHPHGIARTEAAKLEAEFGEFLCSPSGLFEVHRAKQRLARDIGEAA